MERFQGPAPRRRDNNGEVCADCVQYLQSLWTYFWGIYFHFILGDTEVDFVRIFSKICYIPHKNCL